MTETLTTRTFKPYPNRGNIIEGADNFITYTNHNIAYIQIYTASKFKHH